MSKGLNVMAAVPFLQWQGEDAEIPVLTDVLVMATDAQGRTLWLAWDDRRLPVLDDAVEPAEAHPLPRWARKRV
jgi:hypothetical protein